MSSAFDPQQLIIVNSEIVGASGTAMLRLALDTGATTTLINSDMLLSIGYDSALSQSRVQITTASGEEAVPQINIKRFGCSGKGTNRFSGSLLCLTAELRSRWLARSRFLSCKEVGDRF
jgi:hypothetical protein